MGFSFIAKSKASQKALNILRVSKDLPVNILVYGEEGVGKETLLQEVFPDLPKLQTKDQKLVFIKDIDKQKSLLKTYKDKRVIATARVIDEELEEFFPVALYLPPLKERLEDVEELKKLFIQQAQKEFELEDFSGDFEVDLKKNIYSLKRSIYQRAFLATLDEEKTIELLQNYLEPRVEEGYKSLLEIFEIALLRAAKKRFKSTLALSKVLQLNRATITNKLKKYTSKL